MQTKKKLLDIVKDALKEVPLGCKIRLKHYSIKTEKSYTAWIKQFIFFHQKRHPIEIMGGKKQRGL